VTLVGNTIGCATAALFDPFVAGFTSNPYPHYALWRAREPVHWGRAPDEVGEGCWYVFDHATALAALSDDRLGLEFERVVPPELLPAPRPEHAAFQRMVARWMIFRDPPDHTRLRRAMAPAFSRAALAELDRDITAIARFLFDQTEDRDTIDLIADVAFPLPVLVIGRMLGFADADYGFLKRCSHALLAGIDLRRAEDGDRARREAALAADELADYLRFQIRRRSAERTPDLLGRLIAASLKDENDDDELIANCALLLFAGHETTVNLIGNGVNALLRHPKQLRALIADRDLLPMAIEELARYDSPSQMTFRFAMEQIELGDKHVRPGQPVGIVIGAANRDPAVFSEPDRLDLSRAVNRHLSFGSGRHYCLGAALARREAVAAYSLILERWPDLVLADPSEEAWTPSIGLRGLRELRVRRGNSGSTVMEGGFNDRHGKADGKPLRA
jgi:cytochrome P450